MPMLDSTSATPAGSFAERIGLLMARVGGATRIARMCGFSEGVIRSWRDGHSDPSRARCVKLARTLGVSLVWLVAGEGAMQLDATLAASEDPRSAHIIHRRSAATRLPANAALAPHTHGVDGARLAAAMCLLQSELDLSGSTLNRADNMAMLTELYAVLGPAGAQADAAGMAAFNARLAQRLARAKQST